jgi:transposase-like protein
LAEALLKKVSDSTPPQENGGEIRCPACGSEAVYRYGHVAPGRQRYLCVVCNRQFLPQNPRKQISNRPMCPICSRPMHVYRRETNGIRFRCANYPRCRQFRMILEKGDERQ